MEQRSFDLNNDGSHPHYLLLDIEHQHKLVELMAELITQLFDEREKSHHDQSYQSNQD